MEVIEKKNMQIDIITSKPSLPFNKKHCNINNLQHAGQGFVNVEQCLIIKTQIPYANIDSIGMFK